MWMLTAGPLEHATFDNMRALEAMHSETVAVAAEWDSGASSAGQSAGEENTALRRLRCFKCSAEAEQWLLRSAIAPMSKHAASSLGFDMPDAGLEDSLQLLRCMPTVLVVL